MKPNSPWLLGGGIAVAVAFLGVIGWGRVKDVSVPRPVEWAHVASVCADPAADTHAFATALAVLDEHDLPVRIEPGKCDGRAAIHVHVSPTDIDRLFRSEASYDAPEIRGAFERVVTSGVVMDCHAYVEHADDTEAYAHEILHCLGYDHAVNGPAGHVMNRDYARIGLSDFRGVKP